MSFPGTGITQAVLCPHVNDPPSVGGKMKASYTTAQMLVSLVDAVRRPAPHGTRLSGAVLYNQTRVLDARMHQTHMGSGRCRGLVTILPVHGPGQAAGKAGWVPVLSAFHLELIAECRMCSCMQPIISALVLADRKVGQRCRGHAP